MNTNEMRGFVTPNAGKQYMFYYRGISCRQSNHIFDCLDALNVKIANDPAKTIIEIGTYHGAFTRLLLDHDISRNADIHTFDIVNYVIKRVENIQYHVADCFHDGEAKIRELIALPGRSIIFCDGHNKESEVNFFCRSLKSGDIILCHDYGKTYEIACDPIATGGWPAPDPATGPESQYANVQVELEKNDCVPFMEAVMQRCVWGCFIKT